MALGIPVGRFSSYLPGSFILKYFVSGGLQQEFGYSPVAVTTANLPSPANAGLGAKAWVSDATSRTWGAAPTGGGGITVPVWTDGVTWYIGGSF